MLGSASCWLGRPGCLRLRLAGLVVVVRRQASTLYTRLGLQPGADSKQIKESFYRLSKEFHPDINKDENSLKRFREIAEAYETLSNADKRKEYDKGSNTNIDNRT